MELRAIERIVPATPTSDGAGVKLYRTIGMPDLSDLDPFLLLDEFASEDGADYIAGFPDHPHRGFETVTYMLAGRMRHQDSTGAGGSLKPGGAQWMTAGRGIIHSEMPEQRDGLMRGFQLWVNLPASDKMRAPRYQNLEPDEIPEVHCDDGVTVRVIAGMVGGTSGAVTGIAVDPLYLDIAIPTGVTFEQPIRLGHAGFVYLIDGSASVVTGPGKADTALKPKALGILGVGDGVGLRGAGAGGRVLLVAGRPLHEPVARYGPFVMNTRQEIEQAIADFRAGRF